MFRYRGNAAFRRVLLILISAAVLASCFKPGQEIWRRVLDPGGGSGAVAVRAGSVLVADGARTWKLDLNGNEQWSVPFGADVALDPNGNAFIAGRFIDVMS